NETVSLNVASQALTPPTLTVGAAPTGGRQQEYREMMMMEAHAAAPVAAFSKHGPAFATGRQCVEDGACGRSLSIDARLLQNVAPLLDDACRSCLHSENRSGRSCACTKRPPFLLAFAILCLTRSRPIDERKAATACVGVLGRN
ncbi:MAG: hypothetical protein AAFY44_18185, partial [Pseudomonadota bacterium]